jgi:hypothetical protein
MHSKQKKQYPENKEYLVKWGSLNTLQLSKCNCENSR